MANVADYQDDYQEHMIARGIPSNTVSKRSRDQPTGASTRAPAGPSKSSRVPDPRSADRSAPRPDKSQTASISRRSDLPPQPSDLENRRADKIAEAEEGRSQLKDPRPSKATGRSSTKGRKPARKERIQSDGEASDEDDEVRDICELGTTNLFTFRPFAGTKWR